MDIKLLQNIRPFFENGYRPARGTESYKKFTGYHQAYETVNCLAHVLNLRNEQLATSNLSHKQTYFFYPHLNFQNMKYAKVDIFSMLNDLGLWIEECDPAEEIKDFRSWKCAMYCGAIPDMLDADYHFLLEDAPGIWSSKVGYSPYLEHIYMKNPPHKYSPILAKDMEYKLFGTYKITNPYADKDNPYVQNFNERLNVTDEQKKLKHCIIEGRYLKERLCTEEPVISLFDF